LASAGFWTARLTAIKVIGKFLWEGIWPARLSPDYSYAGVPLFGWSTGWEDLKTVIALLICLSAVILAVRSLRVNPAVFFFTGFFFVAALPTSNLVILIGSIMAERFMYLPLIGLIGWVVCAARWLGARPRPFAIATASVAAALAVLTWERNFVWKDELSLWTSAVEASPHSARPHNNLAKALAQIPGHSSEAIAELKTALQIRPDYAEAHYNLGIDLLPIPGRLAESIAEFEAAVRLAPDLWEAHYNLGNALARAPDRLPEAIAEFQTAVRLNPDFAEAHNNLGNVLARAPGRLPEAIEQWKEAVRIRPDFADAHYNLGIVLSQIAGRETEAVGELQTTLQFYPNLAMAHYRLARLLLAVPGREAEAVSEYETAVHIQPDAQEQRKFMELREKLR
jgi:tetratricopeptide (TPR) repeat protein